MKLVECVPNISEGRNQALINAIAAEVKTVAGIKLLDVDPGKSTNRTVMTFVGPPQEVLEAAFRLIKKAATLVDMRQHKGEHARLGATDVCPFIPISGVTMEECVALAQKLGGRVGEELGIPVYLYAEAATTKTRIRLPDIRAGEYEGLPEKLKDPQWKPDFGPATFNVRAGATVIGARKFLIAYNVNLNGTNVKLAKEVAYAIRESGRAQKPGRFKQCQATGWLIPEYNRAQVSINILDTDVAPLHLVFEACREEAEQRGAHVTGSEIVGMVPRQVLVDAGRYFLKKQGNTSGVPQEELVRTAILSLGLNDVSPFDPKKKIIEEQCMPETPLVSMSVRHFLDEVSSSTPAPGGGSVAALAASLSAALSSMVAALTVGKKGYEEVNEEMKRVGDEAQTLLLTCRHAIDEDADAFKSLQQAMRLPKKTDAEKAARAMAMEAATKKAIQVPLFILEVCPKLLDLASYVCERGNQNSLSDAGVAGLMASAAAKGASYNVLINLPGISDTDWKTTIKQKADELLATISKKALVFETNILKKF